MVKRSAVAKVGESFYLFNIAHWEVYEVQHSVYLESKAIKDPFPQEKQSRPIWTAPSVRREIERWSQ